MDHEHHHTERSDSGNGRSKIVFAVMLAVAAFYLVSEHRAHVLGYLPYLLFLACPLMHLFHHGGHGGHGGHGQSARQGEDAGPDVKARRS
jgi:hypothetical protein